MTLQDDISVVINHGEPQECELTVVFREFVEGPEEKYFVAECLEIPGCVSQGDSEEEAEANIKNAIEACVAVMCTDAMRRQMDYQLTHRDLRGITSQRRLMVRRPQPQLAYA